VANYQLLSYSETGTMILEKSWDKKYK